jgi:two-component system, NarL family, nitrate/nitrite response regulator NarL
MRSPWLSTSVSCGPSKIILLFEHASPADLQKLLTSQIDGCVPLFVSPDTLIGTLDMIVTRDVRVMVMADADRPMIQPAQPEKSHPSETKMEKLQLDGAEHEDVSVSIEFTRAYRSAKSRSSMVS